MSSLEVSSATTSLFKTASLLMVAAVALSGVSSFITDLAVGKVALSLNLEINFKKCDNFFLFFSFQILKNTLAKILWNTWFTMPVILASKEKL